METIFYIYTFTLGLMFWSFASVVIYRLRSKEKWMLFWRSACPSCQTTLKWLDLFPIFSWSTLKWKCRYCNNKIPAIYPILEISMGLVFWLMSSLRLSKIDEMPTIWDIPDLIFLLFIWFFWIVFVFYDILYLEIPEEILAFLISWTFIYLVYSNIWNENFVLTVIAWIISLASYYWIMLWECKKTYIDYIKDYSIITINWALLYFLYVFNWSNLWNNMILDWLIWAYFAFIFFFLQYSLSWGRILWGWDLRIAIFMWLLLWTSMLSAWIMMSYICWSIIWIWLILSKKLKRENLQTVIPFWPFLFVWLILALVWGEKIVYYYQNLLLGTL